MIKRLLLQATYDWNSLVDLANHADEVVSDPQLELELEEDGGYLKVTIEYLKDDSDDDKSL